MRGIKWDELPKQFAAFNIKHAVAKAAAAVRVPRKAPDVEPRAGHAPLPAKEAAGLDGQVDIRIVEYRKRLTDFDGGCSKYMLDALVEAGVLADDSLAYVQSVSRRQVKVDSEEQEKTEVTLWPVS